MNINHHISTRFALQNKLYTNTFFSKVLLVLSQSMQIINPCMSIVSVIEAPILVQMIDIRLRFNNLIILILYEIQIKSKMVLKTLL